MKLSPWMKMASVVGGLVCAGSFSAGVTIVMASPGDGALLATTCTYSQINSALQVEAPDLAAQLAQRPQVQAKLQELLTLPVDQRRERVNQWLDNNAGIRSAIVEKRGTQEGEQKVAMLGRVANTCHEY